ncbi:TPA: hypothetical protein EYN98_19740 [Candidatus Poribacteria bacterium]|jgi:hypothetical protein|nr:hypothetical protein [Candidatus Poribacteria bacterium]HIA68235.1 hypothetical protein [Candidatus Poribacteria bacterium]HIB90614.1 hypothetical protein [Candidatus Poribacteria bacterium]HIB98988.1 hypothetical protein [Candidatus Poribacteria bacterium]HIP08415.1 hypothetical protein [Rhodospirillales bacterium]
MPKKRTSLDVLNLDPDSIQDEIKPEVVPEDTGPAKPKVVKQTAYLPEFVHDQLRKLAFEERKKMHDYLMEGLDLVFQGRGLPSINELKHSID